MRDQEFTPEEQKLLGRLHEQVVLKMRYTPPPPTESHLYEHGFMDLERDGRTYYGFPVWYPKAERNAWLEARFRS